MATDTMIEHRPSPKRSGFIAVGPTHTAVVLAGTDRTELVNALTAVATTSDQLGVRLLVLQTEESMGRDLGARFPSVSWMTITSGATDPERRAVGFRAAGTDAVVFARPAEMADPIWLEALRARAGAAPRSAAEPLSGWVDRLVQRGVAGALGDI